MDGIELNFLPRPIQLFVIMASGLLVFHSVYNSFYNTDSGLFYFFFLLWLMFKYFFIRVSF